jgi:hypothetical protein
VTSSQQNGNLGGLAGVDQICNILAAAEGLPGAGGYLAWLSDIDESPSTRFDPSADAYRLVDGTLVANGWSDLTDGPLQHPIGMREDGIVVIQGGGTAATNPDGTVIAIPAAAPYCDE